MRLAALCMLLLAINLGDSAMAQNADPDSMSTEDIAALAARTEALANLRNAENALIEARKAAEETAEELATAKANADTAVANAEKASAEAKKAQIEAEVQAATAFADALPESDIEGDITVKTNAGKGDVFLLSAKATNDAALLMVADVVAAFSDGDCDTAGGGKLSNCLIALFDGVEAPNLAAWPLFRMQALNLQDTLSRVQTEGNDLHAEASETVEEVRRQLSVSAAGGAEALGGAAAIGGALSATSKLLSFFRSDYTIEGFLEDGNDNMLLSAVARNLQCKGANVIIPKRTPPVAAIGEVFDIIESLDRERLASFQVKANLQALKAAIGDLNEVANAEQKKTLQRLSQRITASINSIDATIAAYDKFIDALLVTDAGKGGLSEIILSRFITSSLLGAGNGGDQSKTVYIMNVKSEKFSGAYYTKKNLWTALGSMPISVAGGTVADFTLLNAETGAVKAAGLYPVHSGYYKAHKVAKQFSREENSDMSAAPCNSVPRDDQSDA